MKGKVAVVTGGASGIGWACVEAFAQAGVSCVIADLDLAGGERAEKKLQEAGTPGLFVKTSVSDSASVRHLVDATIEKFGRLDILVNNAGLQHVAPIDALPEERWDTLIGVMLTGAFLCCKYSLPHMIKQNWGRIVNISSVYGRVAVPFKGAYVTAKHALLGLTKVAALEHAEHGITSNAICPAYVRTPMIEQQIANQAGIFGMTPEDVLKKIMLEPAAIKRMLEPSEVAALVKYLCTDEASGITGAALDIDAGWSAR